MSTSRSAYRGGVIEVVQHQDDRLALLAVQLREQFQNHQLVCHV